MERQHDIEPRCRRDLVEIHLAERSGHDRAGDDAEQHGDIGDEALAPTDQREDDEQHEERDAEPLERAVGRDWRPAPTCPSTILRDRRQAAARPVDADAHQGDADDENDRAGHDGRKQRQQPADEGRDDDAENAGARSPSRKCRGCRSPGCAAIESMGPTEAKVTPIITGSRMPTPGKPIALHERRKTAGEEIGADEKGDLLRREFRAHDR